MAWTRLDHHYTDVLMLVDDYCESLDIETRASFLQSYYKHYKDDINSFIGSFFRHLTQELSWTEKDSDDSFGVNKL